MVDRRIDQLPILKEKRLSGVITSDSIVFNTLPPTDRGEKGNLQIGRLEMDAIALSHAQMITNDVSDSLGETLGNMFRAGSNYSIILSGEEVQGIVTYRDFLKLLPTSKVSEIPISIVGLPDDSLQSEMAKKKFQTSVTLLSKAMPDMTEARAVIKSGESKCRRKDIRFRSSLALQTHIIASKFQVTILAKAFEEIEAWIKELAARNVDKRKKREAARNQSKIFHALGCNSRIYKSS